MIQKSSIVIWKDSDGVEHRSLHAVKVRELSKMLDGHGDKDEVEAIAETLIAKDKLFVDLLTTTEASIPLARAVHGGKKPRKKRHEAEQFQIPAVKALDAAAEKAG